MKHQRNKTCYPRIKIHHKYFPLPWLSHNSVKFPISSKIEPLSCLATKHFSLLLWVYYHNYRPLSIHQYLHQKPSFPIPFKRSVYQVLPHYHTHLLLPPVAVFQEKLIKSHPPTSLVPLLSYKFPSHFFLFPHHLYHQPQVPPHPTLNANISWHNSTP